MKIFKKLGIGLVSAAMLVSTFTFTGCGVAGAVKKAQEGIMKQKIDTIESAIHLSLTKQNKVESSILGGGLSLTTDSITVDVNSAVSKSGKGADVTAHVEATGDTFKADNAAAIWENSYSYLFARENAMYVATSQQAVTDFDTLPLIKADYSYIMELLGGAIGELPVNIEIPEELPEEAMDATTQPLVGFINFAMDTKALTVKGKTFTIDLTKIACHVANDVVTFVNAVNEDMTIKEFFTHPNAKTYLSAVLNYVDSKTVSEIIHATLTNQAREMEEGETNYEYLLYVLEQDSNGKAIGDYTLGVSILGDKESKEALKSVKGFLSDCFKDMTEEKFVMNIPFLGENMKASVTMENCFFVLELDDEYGLKSDKLSGSIQFAMESSLLGEKSAEVYTLTASVENKYNGGVSLLAVNEANVIAHAGDEM